MMGRILGKQPVGAVFRALVSLALISTLFVAHDWRDGFARVGDAALAGICIGLSMFALRNLAHALRWKTLLDAVGVRAEFGWVHRVTYIGASASTFLPSSIGGDLARGWWAHGHGLSVRETAATVVVDRLIGILSMFLLFVLAAPFAEMSVDPIHPSFAGATIAVAGIVVTTALLVSRLTTARRRLTEALQVVRRSVGSMEPGNGLRHLGSALFWSGLGHLAALAAVVAFAHAVDVQIPSLSIMAATAVSWLASLMPISLGGFGPREAVLASLLVRAGTAPEDAIAVAILWDLSIVIQAIVGMVAATIPGTDRRTGATTHDSERGSPASP